ncbi:MAG: hypothetical protein V4475_21800 [Pseudomonadota bacterium]
MGQADKVISFGPPKEAALYFDQVFPMDLSFSWFTALGLKGGSDSGFLYDMQSMGIPFDGKSFDENVVQSLLPNTKNASLIYANQLASNSWMPISIILGIFFNKNAVEDLLNGKNSESIRKLFSYGGIDVESVVEDIRNGKFDSITISEKSKDFIVKSLKDSGFYGAPAWLGLDYQKPKNAVASAENRTDYAIALKNLSLIDPRSVSWENIIEFRKDKDAINSLKRFRLFFTDNFSDKDRNYVADKLYVMLDEYEATSKLWGFKTIQKTLSVAVSNQNMISSSLGTLAPALAGVPLPIAAGVGAVVTLGGCALEFSKIAVDHRNLTSNSPVSYLAKLKTLAE